MELLWHSLWDVFYVKLDSREIDKIWAVLRSLCWDIQNVKKLYINKYVNYVQANKQKMV